MGCGASQPTNRRAHAAGGQRPETNELNGKHKFLGTPAFLEIENPDDGMKWMIVAYAPQSHIGLVFAARDQKGNLVVKDIPDATVAKERDAQKISLAWAWFFKAISLELPKGNLDGDGGAKVAFTPTGGIALDVKMALIGAKDAKKDEFYHVELDPVESSYANTYKYMLEPLSIYYMKRKCEPMEKREAEKERGYCENEYQHVVVRASMEACKGQIDRISPQISSLRDEVNQKETEALQLRVKVDLLQRQLWDVEIGGDDTSTTSVGTKFDPFAHRPHAKPHLVSPAAVRPQLVSAIREVFSNPTDDGHTLAPLDKAVVEKAANAVGKADGQIVSLIANLDAWDFPTFDLERAFNGQQGILTYVTYACLLRSGALGASSPLKISEDTVVDFLTVVEAGYRSNAFHNATHAADTVQAMYHFLCVERIKQHTRLSPAQVFTAILATACHDHDHPGLTNSFLVRTESNLALLYNGKSILESYHAASSLQIAQQPKFDFFKDLPQETASEIRKTFVSMVLATDLSRHMSFITAFQDTLKDCGTIVRENTPAQLLVLQICMKLSDLANCCRSTKYYKEWLTRLNAEQTSVAAAEEEACIPKTSFMQTLGEVEIDLMQGQRGFINYVVLPMVQGLDHLSAGMGIVLQNIRNNVGGF